MCSNEHISVFEFINPKTLAVRVIIILQKYNKVIILMNQY